MPELPPVLAAVTAADPYPFYEELRKSRPFGWDAALGAWVAADAAAVREVLAEPRWRVRPRAEPVPAALAGSPAGEIFGHLVRMDDSPHHARRKAAIQEVLGGLAGAIAPAARERARRLVAAGQGAGELAFRLPVATLGGLLGLPEEQLDRVAALVGAFVRCLAPGGSPEQIEEGKAAAGELLELFRGQLGQQEGPVAELARRLPGEEIAVLANAIGFLTQAYEATAGLIAASAALALIEQPGTAAAVVEEVARRRPPVQNTRRFAGEAFRFRGEEVAEGQMVLVLLAAASRDPEWQAAGAPGWGHGAHACPGSHIATTIATAAIEALLAAGALPESPPPFNCRPSLNTRIPIFGLAARRAS